MNRKIIALIAMLGMSGQVFGALYTANDMLFNCESKNDFDEGRCNGYLAAVSDTQSTLFAWPELKRKTFCLPKGVTLRQLQKVFIKYANDYPGELQIAASGMMVNAFVHTFPCK